MTSTLASGLDDVVAAATRLSHVDGERGELLIAGYPIEELAPHATAEQVAWLLWHGELPAADALATLRRELAAARELPPATLALLRAAAARGVAPMDALRMGAASLSLAPASAPPARAGAALPSAAAGGSPAAADAALGEAVRLTGAFPALVAAHWRFRRGLELPPPRRDLGPAAALFWLLEGEEPAAERVRALDTYLATVADHGLNASTFAARVVVSTGSDLVSAVTAAVGALKGPLHGGAPGPALDTVFAIGVRERAEVVLRDKLARGERLMGFGHRVYRVRDPRADVLGAAAERFYREGGGAGRYADLYDLARHVETTALRLLREKKPDRRLDTNVEFYTALLLHGLGLGTELFTPTFAIGRVAGWTAHCLEQLREGRLIRPRADYVGPRGRRWPRAV
jgi:citrate synthase